MKVAVVTSSISCLAPDQVRRYGIKVVPVPFTLDGHSHLDGIDISAAEVYEQLAYKRPFRTSAPSPGDYLKAYQEASNGSKDVLCLTVPSKISMMYDSARSAAEQMPRDRIVRVVDTGTAAGGQALIDLAAARAASSGATLEEVTQLVTELGSRVRLYGMIVAPQYSGTDWPSALPAAIDSLGTQHQAALYYRWRQSKTHRRCPQRKGRSQPHALNGACPGETEGNSCHHSTRQCTRTG